MRTEKLTIKGMCFGEVLWDNLPTGRQLGGAPLNVAYHLNKLGVETLLLTRVGEDEAGDDLLQRCASLGIPTGLFQRDPIHPTSTVEVHIDKNRDVTYEILFPVAWDYIALGEQELQAVKEADFLVFGSLSTRNQVSYETWKLLLPFAKFKVLDVNLRAPFYTPERVLELLSHVDLVKMNQEELGMVATWMGLAETSTDRMKVDAIMDKCCVDEIIITYGAKGAVYHVQSAGFSYHFPALPVRVKDTIGSGDSFLAAFLAQRCRKDKVTSPEEMLSFAATLSGFITQSEGACPIYHAATLNRFQWLHDLEAFHINGAS
ncbi:carbohydrate kinase family protein [Sphingobacterium griseoflavum]|uniref:2-dehydro-3-deoxygluconokinase n=1 Tax=Sphingobacterium griseoflavum TaxID=1474952 RepID=A0ABQ3HVB1_9SPHI|nr:carbohydrate kinase [Sphingobacterium griseoflavum]GHE31623.1 2-dehydro-3-deoxygluconokinase [Sphingobacterium griseoflavum]